MDAKTHSKTDKQMNKYILILSGDYALRERVLAGALRASGGMPVFTTVKSPTSNTSKFFDGHISCDTSDSNSLLAAVRQYEQEHQHIPAAVIPINELGVRSAVAVSAHYGINHNSVDTINKCRDKLLMKQALANAGLPVPRFGTFLT